MKFYLVEEDKSAGFTGNLRALPPWGLPGVGPCNACGAAGGWAGLQYPCVDLSGLQERNALENPGRQVSFEEFSRLRDLVRPFAPDWARLEPGADFGPPTGTGSGTFGDLFLQNPWSLFIRREAVECLQGAGIHGLSGCPLNVRFRGKNPPELLAMQLELHGRLHIDGVPPEESPACLTCGVSRHELPRPPILDVHSTPVPQDLFRLYNWPTLIVASERMVAAVQQLCLRGIRFSELATRQGPSISVT
ncbi:double-CXXCG motif protein [Myxococcus xanthus]|uniref:SitI6 family double-CXXCG motif immunity protein n=1 Tax=Myxococcus xanthus TaxID=34 RepID=UPI00112C3985|nr:double-CXXCG motif protein [Myxococcus xanthus]